MAKPVDEIAQKLKELPARRYIDTLRSVINDLVRKVDTSARWDQYPGKTMPYCFSKLYGPFGLIRSGRSKVGGGVAAGFNEYATLASPGVFLLPRNTNILTGRDIAFYWDSIDVFGMYSVTYGRDPQLYWSEAAVPPPPQPVNPAIWNGSAVPPALYPPAGLFDSVMEKDGGAAMLMNFSNAFTPNALVNGMIFPQRPLATVPHISFDFDLYDRKRGRSLTGGRVPCTVLAGGTYNFKSLFNGREMRFDPDSEIEPRVYLNEVRMTEAQDFSQPPADPNYAFQSSQVTCYLNIVFKGKKAVQERQESGE